MRPGTGPGGEWATGEQHVKVRPDQHTMAAINKMKFTWEKRRNIFPRDCYKTKKHLWPFMTVYRGRKIMSGPYGDYILERWIHPEAYMFEKLKGNI